MATAATAGATTGAAIASSVALTMQKIGDWIKDIAKLVWDLLKKLGSWFIVGVKWLGARIRDAMRGARSAVGHLVNFIAHVLRAAWEWLKSVVPKMFSELMKLIRWYMRLLAEKPEVGLTATLLFLYLLS